MILLIVITSVLNAGLTIYQYKEQAEDYHLSKLGRKEEAVKSAINYELTRKTTFSVETKNLPFIFQEEIYQIADIHKLDVSIFDLQGKLLKSSRGSFIRDSLPKDVSKEILNLMVRNYDHRVIDEKIREDEELISSYTYITDNKFKPIGILNLQYYPDNTFQDKELTEFLSRLSAVYFMMLLIAIITAYFISSYITGPLQKVSDKISQTRLSEKNQKIIIENTSEEIGNLIHSYNLMVDALEESADKLAKSEREHAWREMAKQVAHEIKNPLTPMRLSLQNFEQKFDPKDPKIHEKVRDLSIIMIQQIDLMSSIASAFSDFAKMPTQHKEQLDLIEVVKHAIEIFTESYIYFESDITHLQVELDKNQLTRIITNLLNNALYAVQDIENPAVYVKVSRSENNIVITISDNGKGIDEDIKDKVFEPKFTTKSSGMGLGLPMVKNIIETYNGTISFTSKFNKGTTFIITLPI
ncbi:MAG: HAMP domain-containing sensor histidine kinase [Flavobacteriaceae bacterium]|nr:HAMP domain-containing sensor histidine kinase [Flavobacteriaceae bacterium]